MCSGNRVDLHERLISDRSSDTNKVLSWLLVTRYFIIVVGIMWPDCLVRELTDKELSPKQAVFSH